jgi:hypothetical protein
VRIRQRVLFISMFISLASPGVRAVCVDLSGPDIVPRHPSIAQEFASAPWVFIGRATASRDVPSPDDPGFYDWTIYEVEVLKVFKGKPPHRIRLQSENTSGRFPMDRGKEYLLFVSHSPVVEMAGKEKLPGDYVDNCGHSGSIEEAGAAIRAVQDFSGAK